MNENVEELFAASADKEYRNLKDVKLSAAARLFLCEKINNSSERLTVSEASKRYNLNRKTVSSWYSRFNERGKFYDSNGRPPELDAEAVQSLKTKLQTSPNLEASEIFDFYIEMAKLETRKRRRSGIASYPICHDFFCDKTLISYKKKINSN